MKRLLLAAAMALGVHATSHAGVTYEWLRVDDGKPAGVAMTLVFSDDAVASGKLGYHVQPGSAATPTGLDALAFSVDTITPMRYAPAGGTWNSPLWRLDLDLAFDAAGYLTGRIMANDQNSDFTMTSDGTGLFTFGAMHSDEDWFGTRITCDSAATCTSTGRLVRVDAGPSGQVPEPGGLALMASGILGLLMLRTCLRLRAAQPNSQ